MAFLPFWFVTSVNTFLILIFVTLYLRQTVIHKIDSTAAYALGLVIYIWFPNFEMVMTKMFPKQGFAYHGVMQPSICLYFFKHRHITLPLMILVCFPRSYGSYSDPVQIFSFTMTI